MDRLHLFKRLAKNRLPYVDSEKDMSSLLEKLQLMENGQLKRAAIVLFGKNPKKFFTSAFLRIGKFQTDTELLGSDTITGNLFQQVSEAIDILKKKYLMANVSYEGIYRKETLEYPEDALREAVINAVIHKDYLGTHIQIKVYLSKLEIWNEGKLPPDVRIDDLKTNHLSRPRNDLLAGTFFEANLIESWGRGTVKIFESCLAQKLPEPKFEEYFGGLLVTFYKEKHQKQKHKKVSLNNRQIKILSIARKTGRFTISELIPHFDGVTERTLRRDLSDLANKGFVQAKSEKRHRFYEIT